MTNMKTQLLAMLLALSAAGVAAEPIQYINVEAAKSLHENGAQFIDTRSFIETKFGMIEGSVRIPHDEIQDHQATIDKQKPVVLYCAVGGRAGKAAKTLHSLGYQQVHVISDGQGFSDWEDAGYPLEP
ncbi:MAG: rhodanese-like domain-containing protein [Pseudomonadales bacterium]